MTTDNLAHGDTSGWRRIVEGEGSGASDWFSVQMARARAFDGTIDSPVFQTDLGWDPGQAVDTRPILVTYYTFADGVSQQVAVRSSGVVRCDSVGPDNSEAFVLGAYIIKEMATSSWYLVARTLPIGVPSTAGTIRILAGAIHTDFIYQVLLYETLGVLHLSMFTLGQPGIDLVSDVELDFTHAHDYAVGFNHALGIVQAFEDGAPIPDLSTTDLSALPTSIVDGINPGAGAVGPSTAEVLIDKVAFLTPSLDTP